MKRVRQCTGIAVLLVVTLMILVGVWMGGAARATVDWRRVRAVVFESDDWGLAGFVPDEAALDGLDRQALQAGRFPEVYWESTLEDSAGVSRLARLLARFEGGDGLSPVIQANYIMSALARREESPLTLPLERRLHQYDLPQLPRLYARPGLWQSVDAAIAQGVWRPELHGSFHYDPQRRRQAVATDVTAARAAARGVLVFPGSHRAWELGSWRSEDELEAELDHTLRLFTDLFGRPPVSIMAPDYVWDARCEALWERRGLMVIQAKREQRHTYLKGGGLLPRLRKVLDRALARLIHPGRTYLERNCRLEAAQIGDWEQVAAECHAEILSAWQRGEPAIVETHRVNYVHLHPEVAEAGFRALKQLLELLTAEGEPPPRFLTDTEVAQLSRSGTSWSVRGSHIVVRNYNRSRHLVAVPSMNYIRSPDSRRPRIQEGAIRLIAVIPQGTLLVPLADAGR